MGLGSPPARPSTAWQRWCDMLCPGRDLVITGGATLQLFKTETSAPAAIGCPITHAFSHPPHLLSFHYVAYHRFVPPGARLRRVCLCLVVLTQSVQGCRLPVAACWHAAKGHTQCPPLLQEPLPPTAFKDTAGGLAVVRAEQCCAAVSVRPDGIPLHRTHLAPPACRSLLAEEGVYSVATQAACGLEPSTEDFLR